MLLSMANVKKSFGPVKALHDASLDVQSGEIHALIGQNGAGKSTLIKVLTGVHQRDSDSGAVIFNGQPIDLTSTRQAQEAGIATIYQELNLVPLRSVTENIVMGYEPRKFGGLIDWKAARTRAKELLDDFGIDVDVDVPLGHYSTAIQQLVAIVRAVSLDAKLVIMDEPTSSLDECEIDMLFGVIRRLKTANVAVLYVSHFLDELFEICDRVTVLRDGVSTAVVSIAQTSKLNLIAEMLGRDAHEIASAGRTEFSELKNEFGEVALKADRLSTSAGLRDFNLEIKNGQIVGLGGLLGSGRTEAARALFGVDRLNSGDILISGKKVRQYTPAQAIEAGLGYLSENRKTEGIIPELSVRENLTLAILPKITKAGIIDHHKEREIVESYMKALSIKASSIEQPIKELSGGNQQKVLLARWLAIAPDILILDEPTRGVDIGAKSEIQTVIGKYISDGKSIVLISSEFEEIIEGAHSIVIMNEGHSTKVIPTEGLTESTLVRAFSEKAETA